MRVRGTNESEDPTDVALLCVSLISESCETRHDLSMSPQRKSRLLQLCTQQIWRSEKILECDFWQWLWRSNPVDSTHQLQQHMVRARWEAGVIEPRT